RDLVIGMDFHPSKVLGQNFLVDGNILDILLDCADLQPNDQVLEIGPGLGVVTDQLLRRVGRVVAVEKDYRLAELLQERWGEVDNLELIQGDALDCNMEDILASGINKLVSNLPYSAGSRILIDMASADVMPEKIVVTLQDEVAQRLAALPGTKNYGLLSVRVQISYDVTVVKKISNNCFWPVPKVESSIIELTRCKSYGLAPEKTKLFRRLLKISFAHRRKQMQGILAKQASDLGLTQQTAGELLAGLGISPQARPGDLAVSDWVSLAQAIQV
ncbi:MAG: ribosomal RNA small subunit methyltransferase A, partial [Kiritimatiellae bacterium]|nr:ribosomal RNA small subunit methyltransferase A [Kiritimatiellia bacterium]